MVFPAFWLVKNSAINPQIVSFWSINRIIFKPMKLKFCIRTANHNHFEAKLTNQIKVEKSTKFKFLNF